MGKEHTFYLSILEAHTGILTYFPVFNKGKDKVWIVVVAIPHPNVSKFGLLRHGGSVAERGWRWQEKRCCQEFDSGLAACQFFDRENGDLGGSRTPNPQGRNLLLYPVELRGHKSGGE